MKIVDRDDVPLVAPINIFSVISTSRAVASLPRSASGFPKRLRSDYDGVLIELVSDGWQVQCIEGEQQTDTGLKYLGRARKGQGVRTLWLREADLGRRLSKDFKAAQRLKRRKAR
jgi:hypothetical protein